MSPAHGRDQTEPMVTREPDARNVAMTPLNDLNLAKDQIPSVLLTAAADPYASGGLSKCPAIQAAIGELDAVLGPDMDVNQAESDRISTGRVAKSVVASFIPFRGILRELSGAAEQERAWQTAIYAGAVRRGYLKGLGQQKGCAYPARPAFARVAVSTPAAAAEAPAKTARRRAKSARVHDTAFVASPVVQTVPGSNP